MKINFDNWSRVLLAIFIAAFLVRGIYILNLKDGFYFPDSSDYSVSAVTLLEHGEFGVAYKRAPVYPVFLAGIYALFGKGILGVRLVQAAMGACLAVMIAALAKRLGGVRVGVLAGLLWSIYPLGIFIAGLVYPETVATVLLVAAVWCLVPHADGQLRTKHVLLGGILFGFAALTKPVVLGTIALLAVWMMYWWRQQWYILVPVFLLGIVLPLTPWTIRNYQVYGHLVAVEPRLVQHLPTVDKAQKRVSIDKRKGRVQSILNRPGRFAAHFIKEFGHFWELYPTRVRMTRSYIRQKMQKKDARIIADKTVVFSNWTNLVSLASTVPMFCFALIGVGAMGIRREHRRNLSLLLVLIFSFATGYAFFIAKIRYRVPIEPYILMLSAFGLQQAWALCRRKKKACGDQPKTAAPVG